MHDAAIGENGRRRQIARPVSREKDHDIGNLLGLSHAAERDCGVQLRHQGRVLHCREVDRRRHGARTDADHQHAVGRQFDASCARQHPHTPFGDAISGIAGHRPILMDGGDVDDAPAAALFEHLLSGNLRAEKCALEVDREDLPVLRFRGVENRRSRFDAGVVHHDVNAPELSHCSVDEHLQVGDPTDVGVDGDHPIVERNNLTFQGLGRIEVGDIVYDDAGASAGETERDRLADPTVASRDNRDLIFQRHCVRSIKRCCYDLTSAKSQARGNACNATNDSLPVRSNCRGRG